MQPILNLKRKVDEEQEYRYRLSMDPQLTVPGERVTAFVSKYSDWYRWRNKGVTDKQPALSAYNGLTETRRAP